MKRHLFVAVFCLLIGLTQAVVLQALAQSPTTPTTSAPGAGHGFLIDKHVAAGLTCNKCHTVSTAKAPEMATCLSCHGGTYDKLAAMTASDQPNPHASHLGDLPCAQCHHVHMASVTKCNQCHTYDMTTP
jgi:fumarate reductase flavoprotein subunit